MRGTKFRVWDLEDKQFVPFMLNEKGIWLYQKRNGVMVEDINNHRWKLMQSTGLQDKNDVEIYEGDIVKDSSGRLMIVEWDDRLGTARFILKTINRISHIQAGRYLDIHQWITSDENDLEIIGNTYQNKEIIENIEKHYFN